MCYGIRAEAAEPGREGAALPSRGPQNLRPRLAGAAVAVLVAGFAVAALVTRPAPSQPMREKAPAARVPVALQPAVPAGGAIEQVSTGLDDGVPTAFNETKRDCHHGL